VAEVGNNWFRIASEESRKNEGGRAILNNGDGLVCDRTIGFRANKIDENGRVFPLGGIEVCRHLRRGMDVRRNLDVAFEQLLEAAMNTNNNTIVYFLHHPQFSDDNSTKPQTVGKMLDNQLCIEGLFPIVIECMVNEDGHRFITKNNGQNIAKAPMGMLPEEMDNDLAEVDKLIREYWNMEPLKEMEVTNDTETN